jgi:hypothetical protein
MNNTITMRTIKKALRIVQDRDITDEDIIAETYVLNDDAAAFNEVITKKEIAWSFINDEECGIAEQILARTIFPDEAL